MKSFHKWLVVVLVVAQLLAANPLHAVERKRRKDRTATETPGASTNAAPGAATTPGTTAPGAATPGTPGATPAGVQPPTAGKPGTPPPPPTASPGFKVVRPALGEELTVSAGSTFVIGTIPSDQYTLRCNGKLCDVFSEGAFVGYVPIKRLTTPITIDQKTMDAVFEFVAVLGQTRMTNIVYCVTPASPSSKKVVSEKLAQPRVMESTDDRWVAMENETLSDGKPLSNLGKIVFFPKGSRIKVKEKKGETLLVEQPIENGSLWIPASEFKEVQQPVQQPILSTEFKSEKKQGATVYSFATPEVVPLVIEESADRSTLELRFLSTPPRAFVFPQPASIWGFDIACENGETKATVKFAPTINKDKPFQGLKIVLDPGHNPDPGALGPRGTEERKLTLLLARQLGELLKAQGAIVTLSREDEPLELSQRHAKFKAANPDLIISLHLNSVTEDEDPRLRWGTQTIYLFPHSQPIAKSIYRYLSPTVRGHDLSYVQRNLLVTRFPTVPTVLVESTHIIMPDEEKKLLTPEYRAEIAKSIFDGISNFLLGEAGAKR